MEPVIMLVTWDSLFGLLGITLALSLKQGDYKPCQNCGSTPPACGLLPRSNELRYGYLPGLPKWPEAGVRKPSATGLLKIRAILRPMMGEDLTSVDGQTRFLAEREGLKPRIL